jgi:hypothetical protein
MDLALGQTVVAHEHVFRIDLGEQRARDLGLRLDEAGIQAEGRDHPKARDFEAAACLAIGAIEQRPRGGGRRLRKEGHQRDRVRARGSQPPEPLGDRGLAVAHRDLDAEALVEALAHLSGQPLGAHQQGGASLRPDLRVGRRRAPRPHPEDHAVKQRRAQRSRQIDHARVAEELA